MVPFTVLSKKSATEGVFVYASPPNSYVETLTLNMMVLGGEALVGDYAMSVGPVMGLALL